MSAKAKPRELKVIEGTFRKDRDNPKQPTPQRGIPADPDFMVPAVKDNYKALCEKLHAMGVLTVADGGVVAMAAQREHELGILNKDIEENGNTIIATDKEGNVTMIRANPSVTQRNECMRDLRLLYNELGLTPATRNKVSVVKETREEDNPFKPL